MGINKVAGEQVTRKLIRSVDLIRLFRCSDVLCAKSNSSLGTVARRDIDVKSGVGWKKQNSDNQYAPNTNTRLLNSVYDRLVAIQIYMIGRKICRSQKRHAL